MPKGRNLRIVTLAEQNQLESILDRVSDPAALVYALSEIAHGKASHAEESWQDNDLSERWTNVAHLLDVASDRLSRIPNPFME